MCGIAGYINHDGRTKAEGDLVRRMCDVIAHRGPDNHGVWTDGSVGLGHRRLSILDLSEAGRQPMCNDDETIWITYNGEIYNFQELAQDLKNMGHSFRTRTDTEVILRLYEKHGPECVSMLRGMFAFAIWDGRQRQLFLARDRVGIKPLYYSSNVDHLVFGSELKAILVHPDVKKTLDPVSLQHYLTWLYVPSPRSMFQGISKLPAAHYLICKDGQTTITRYWEPSQVLPDRWGNIDEAANDLEERLSEAVSQHMISDVPLGVFLSGGIDSSVITALAARASSRPIKTFSVAMNHAGFDESPYAQMVATRYGTDHHILKVSDATITPEAIEALTYHYDEPFADSSALPTEMLSRLTREHVTVALAGDGGDELFAGYNHLLRLYRLRDARKRLKSLGLNSIAGLAGTLAGRALKPLLPNLSRTVSRSAEALKLGLPDSLGYMKTFFSPEAVEGLVMQEFWASLPPSQSVYGTVHDLVSRRGTDDDVDLSLYVELNTSLVDDMLVKVDRASMRHGLEVRVPLLDHKIVDWAFGLPSCYKHGGGEGKLVLRRLAHRLLPAEVIERPKQGFEIPLHRSLSRESQDMVRDALSPESVSARGIFQPAAVARLLNQFFDPHDRFLGEVSRYQVNHRTWALFLLEQWFRRFLN